MALDPRYMAASDFPDYFVDKNSGLPLSAGILTFYSDVNRTVLKSVFMLTGSPPDYSFIELPNPLVLSAVGTIISPDSNSENIIPYFFPYDADGEVENYYYTVVSAGFVPQADFPNVPGIEASGVAVPTTNNENMIVNGAFYYNVRSTNNPILPGGGSITLAPGASAGLITPDITYNCGINTSVDEIEFKTFLPAEIPLLNQPVPPFYLNYRCFNIPTGEPLKYIEFPISSDVLSFQNTPVVFSILAQTENLNSITVSVYQNFGTGGSPTPPSLTEIFASTLTSVFTVYNFSYIFPIITGNTLGTNGDDYISVRVYLEGNVVNNTSFTNFQMTIGESIINYTYETPDMIAAKVFTERTGEIIIGLDSYRPGYIFMDDGTIGNSDSNATSLANPVTYPLFYKIWNKITSTYAPIFNQDGSLGTRGASASDDYSANKAIALTRMLGRVIGATNNNEATPLDVQEWTINPSDTSHLTLSRYTGLGYYQGSAVQLASTGTLPNAGAGGPILPGVTYYCIPVSGTDILLSSTLDNAVANVNDIGLFSGGTGTFTIILLGTPQSHGRYTGEYNHANTINEMPNHNHSVPANPGVLVGAGGGSVWGTGSGAPFTGYEGGSGYHNNMQPCVFMYVLMKL